MKQERINKILIITVLVLMVVIFTLFTSDDKSNSSPSANLGNQANYQAPEQQQLSKDNTYNFVYSLTNVLQKLYLSTQELDNVQKKYPTSALEIQNTTAMLAIDSDLSSALTILEQYRNDENKGISSSAGLLYVDILKLSTANKAVINAFRSATPETFNSQDVKYLIAQFVASQEEIQKDLFENQVLFIVTKGLIQLPGENNNGPIRYSLSQSERQDLINNIQTTFGSELENYKSNTYLLAAKVIEISLTFDTYEELKDFKL